MRRPKRNCRKANHGPAEPAADHAGRGCKQPALNHDFCPPTPPKGVPERAKRAKRAISLTDPTVADTTSANTSNTVPGPGPVPGPADAPRTPPRPTRSVLRNHTNTPSAPAGRKKPPSGKAGSAGPRTGVTAGSVGGRTGVGLPKDASTMEIVSAGSAGTGRPSSRLTTISSGRSSNAAYASSVLGLVAASATTMAIIPASVPSATTGVSAVPAPRSGYKVLVVTIPRTDLNNPKSKFGVCFTTRGKCPRVVVTTVNKGTGETGNSAIKVDDIVTAVNGTVVCDTSTMKMTRNSNFKSVLQLMKDTEEGEPLRLVLLRRINMDEDDESAMDIDAPSATVPRPKRSSSGRRPAMEVGAAGAGATGAAVAYAATANAKYSGRNDRSRGGTAPAVDRNTASTGAAATTNPPTSVSSRQRGRKIGTASATITTSSSSSSSSSSRKRRRLAAHQQQGPRVSLRLVQNDAASSHENPTVRKLIDNEWGDLSNIVAAAFPDGSKHCVYVKEETNVIEIFAIYPPQDGTPEEPYDNKTSRILIKAFGGMISSPSRRRGFVRMSISMRFDAFCFQIPVSLRIALPE